MYFKNRKAINKEKMDKCSNYFDELAALLADRYEIIRSCNSDFSTYLVPIGTACDISYYGKPEGSFRLSDHWNWYASLKKCNDENHIQCFSPDMPWAKKRNEEGRASNPIFGCQVAFFGKDKKYHNVYGEKFDRKTKKWEFDEGVDPKDFLIAAGIL